MALLPLVMDGVFISILVWIVPCIAVDLVCLWEKVSSDSSNKPPSRLPHHKTLLDNTKNIKTPVVMKLRFPL